METMQRADLGVSEPPGRLGGDKCDRETALHDNHLLR